MVRTPLDPRPRRIHQIHLWPGGRRNLALFQDVPPVPRTGHPHRLEPNPHHRTARRMADTVPGNPTTCHHPQADGGTRGGPQRTHPHCRLHLAMRPRGRPPGHSSAHAMDGCCQDSGAAHIPHPQEPAACSHPAPNGPSPPPQTPVLPTVRTCPTTYHQHGTPRHTIHQAQDQHGTHEHHRHRAHTHQHARATRPGSPTPPSVHRYRQPPGTACPLCLHQRLPQTALPCNPDHWVCLGAAHRLTHCPHCGYPNPHHRERPAAPAAPPPCQPPELLRATHGRPPGPTGRVLHGGRSRPRVDHSHGHGQHNPAPSRPASAPQRVRLERGGPPRPSRPIPPSP